MNKISVFLNRIPSVYLGFFSGAVFGLILAFCSDMVIIQYAFNIPDFVVPYFLEYLRYLTVFCGSSLVLLILIAVVSHFIRRRYGIVCGCAASSYCGSDDDEQSPNGVL